jgi:hypothetical protein
MEDSITLERVRPVTITKMAIGRPAKYPFGALTDVGQSFWLPATMVAYSTIYNAVWRQNRRDSSRAFVASKAIKRYKKGYRVQRIK